MIDTNIFCEALEEKNRLKLLQIPKSDLHNHSSKGCRREWLEEQLKRNLPKAPDTFGGLEEMHEWFTSSIKPYCKGAEGLILRWKGAFEEAGRNHKENRKAASAFAKRIAGNAWRRADDGIQAWESGICLNMD